MKKTYLAPMSEALSAILKDLCATDDPDNVQGSSGYGTGGGDPRFTAPIHRI